MNLRARPFGLGDLQFGDFDSDGKTDVFSTRSLPDGRLEWVYWAGGAGDPIVLNTVDGPVPRLGEFVGDGRTDALIVQCGAAPVVEPLPAIDATKIPRTIFRYALGDANGDGHPDVIRSSVCQNYDSNVGFCGMTTNIVEILFGDGRGGFSLPTPDQRLFSTVSLDETSPFSADVTGDGRTFALSSLQSLSASGWRNFRAFEGDVNGDGNSDVVFSSTCQRNSFSDFTCTAGAANLVSVALGDGNGGFTLGPRQTYETSGWDTFAFTGVLDLNGDGRDDLVWISQCDAVSSFCEVGSSLVTRAGLANGDGTFTVTPPDDLGFGYWTSFRLERGDVDGDGKSDVILHAVGTDRKDSAAVYVLFSNGSGGFTASPMQLLHGRGWYSSGIGFISLAVADLTGDGKVELNWFDTSPADHDRIIVSGNVAAITATTTTSTTIATGTTVTTITSVTPTTTTIPTITPPPDCAAQPGLAGAQCFCAAPLAPAACAGATLPTKLTTKFGKACTLLGTAAAASSPKKEKKLLGKMASRLGGLVRLASRKATTKNLPPGCGTALRGQLSAMKTDVVGARKSVGH